MSPTLRASIALLFVTTACVAKNDATTDTTKVVDSTTVTTTSPSPTTQNPPAPSPPATQNPAPTPPDTTRTTNWTVTAAGLGPLRAGQAIAQANTAVGGGFSGSTDQCTYAVWPKAPSGVAVMLSNGKVARVEVRSGTVTTANGAGIGDTEARIKALYTNRVTSTAHKYNQGGHYLTVEGPNAANRIVFETDGVKVTNYRSGRVPEVEQVERCG